MTRFHSHFVFRPRPWFVRTLLCAMLASTITPSLAQIRSDTNGSSPIVPSVSPLLPPLVGFSSSAHGSGSTGGIGSTPSVRPGSGGASILQIYGNDGDNGTNPTGISNLPGITQKPTLKNEFQDFITQAVGRELPMYGRDLFYGGASSFSPSQNVAVPGDYIIGVGDQLHIRSTGGIDIDYHATVDVNGHISIPRIGHLNVAGTRFSDIQSLLKQSIGRLYRNFDLYVSMGRLRSIRVYLVGHVQAPGAYTVSSLSTLINALLYAGGPSSSGSLRNIQVKRAGKLITHFDLYDFLINGDKTKDIRLMPEDVIYVSPVGKLAALNGSVNQPAVYELRDNESLGDLFRFAGGVTPVASSENISIERIVNRKQRTVKQLGWNASTLKQPLHDGDLVTVLDISRKFDRIITVRGHVVRPIRMPWREGLRIHDVIPSKEMLITQDYYANVENLTKRNPHDLQAQKNDTVENLESVTNLNRDIKSIKIKHTNLSSSSSGSDIAPPPNSTDIKRLIREPNFEYAVIERLKEDLTQEIIAFNLGKALNNDPKENKMLRPNDVITIFAKDDIEVPRSQQTGFVRLEGEFIASGIYRIEPGETLKQVIDRAGGIMSDAFLYGINLQRKSTREMQKIRYAEWLERMERDLLRSYASQRALTAEDLATQKAEQENRKLLISRLRTLQPQGRVVFNFRQNINPAIRDLPDLVLEDGDKILMPYKSSTVSVLGAIVNDGTFLFRPSKPMSDYIDDAGGITEYADKNAVYVVRVDGSVTGLSGKVGLFGWLAPHNNIEILPGDTIVMPEKVGGKSIWSTLKDFSTIFYQFGLGAAAIKVLKN